MGIQIPSEELVAHLDSIAVLYADGKDVGNVEHEVEVLDVHSVDSIDVVEVGSLGLVGSLGEGIVVKRGDLIDDVKTGGLVVSVNRLGSSSGDNAIKAREVLNGLDDSRRAPNCINIVEDILVPGNHCSWIRPSNNDDFAIRNRTICLELSNKLVNIVQGLSSVQ